jgi:hypothetical protein
MSSTYGAMPPQGYGGGGNPRDRLTTALLEIQNPPPGNMQPVGGTNSLPQQQPAAQGASAPPMGAMGSMGGPMQPGLQLPGITPPGQLPLGMAPQGMQGAPGQQGMGPGAQAPMPPQPQRY